MSLKWMSSPTKKKHKTEMTNNGDVVKIVFSSAGHPKNQLFHFELDGKLRVTKLISSIHIYVGDTILAYNDIDLRGKTLADYLALIAKEKPGKNVELLILRVNGHRGFTQWEILIDSSPL